MHKHLKKKIQEKNGIVVLEVFNNVVESAVKAVNQTIVKRVKRRSRSLTETEKINCKNQAVEYIKSVLNDQTKKDIKYIVKDINTYIDCAIEDKVVNQKETRGF